LLTFPLGDTAQVSVVSKYLCEKSVTLYADRQGRREGGREGWEGGREGLLTFSLNDTAEVGGVA